MTNEVKPSSVKTGGLSVLGFTLGVDADPRPLIVAFIDDDECMTST